MAQGSIGSAGTGDTRVDRPEEGLAGLATKGTAGWPENPTANPPSRASFDAGLAAGGKRAVQSAQIDTSQNGIDPWTALKRGLPGAWV